MLDARPPRRPLVDVMDSTWLPARAAVVAPLVADPACWPRWWPGLTLRPAQLRGGKGVRWHVDSVAGHPGLAGSAEVWLQAQGDGVVAHFFLRLDPSCPDVRCPDRTVGGTWRAARAARRRQRELGHLRDRYRRLTKQAFWALADELDPGRRHRARHHRLH